MTEDEVRKVVTFVRSHMPGWKRNNLEEDFKVYFYNRRVERNWDDGLDEDYVQAYLNDTPTQQS